MRTVPASVTTALTTQPTYSLEVDAVIEKSLVFVSTIDYDNPVSIAEASGISDSPLPQDIGWNPTNGYVVTFYNDSGTLKYSKQGSATLISTGQSMSGKPGYCDGHVYFQNGSLEIRDLTVNWGSVHSGSGTFWSANNLVGTLTSGSAVVHGVSSTECVAIVDSDGGLQATYFSDESGWVERIAPYRFVFPMASIFTPTRVWYSYALFSTALKLDNKVHIFVSNAQSGMVNATRYDKDADGWSDIYIAVPTSIDTSMCEIRLCGGYTYADTAYLVGQLRRTQEADAQSIYSMVLKSRDGKIFSIDMTSVVSDLGYRFNTLVADRKLYLAHCNRVAYKDLGEPFAGTSGSAVSLALPATDIIGFDDNSSMSSNLIIATGDESYIDSSYLSFGNRVTVNVNCKTTSGSAFEKTRYGTYIIDSIPKMYMDGSREISLALANESSWRLDQMSSPYYAEYLSKSSLYEEFTSEEASGMFYTSGSSGFYEDGMMVDFWNCEPWTGTAASVSVTGLENDFKGAPSWFLVPASACYGFRTQDLSEELYLETNPIITSGSLTTKIYGWCHPYTDDGTTNAEIGIILFLRLADGTETTVSAKGSKFPITWPTTVGGDMPVTYTFTDLAIGTKLERIGVFVYNNTSKQMQTNLSRVEVSNVLVTRSDDSNTPWKSTGSTGLELPGYCRPYTMFATKPYNAFNFTCSARFESTVTGGISGYTIGYGIVGLGLDGSNYVLGRYDKVSNKVEIVKVRNRKETVLVSTTPTFTVGDTRDLMFTHKDGLFRVLLRNDSLLWVEQTSYLWKDTDGVMFPGTIEAMHVGIWGLIDVPHFRIVGLDIGADEDGVNADAIPAMPLSYSMLGDFLSSGSAVIEDQVYTYSSVVSMADESIRGPYQFRNQSDGSSAAYTSPYGIGEPGLEYLDFEWNLATSAMANKYISLDDGGVYKIIESLWQVYITTDGQPVYLRNRSRHYSDNVKISETYHDCSNRGFITGGLVGPALIRGEAVFHPINTLCRQYTQGRIACYEFNGSSGDFDATIQDLVDTICKTCNATAVFPGDVVVASYTGTSTTVGTKEYAEGFDLRFESTLPSNGNAIAIECDVTSGSAFDSGRVLDMMIEHISGTSMTVSLYDGATLIEQYPFSLTSSSHVFRVLFHDNFFTLYVDDAWVYTFGIEKATYDLSSDIILGASESKTFTNIILKDMSDWREAVYIDLETNGKSALGSIIQERPVEVIGKSDGSIAFIYDNVPTTITINSTNEWIRRHSIQRKSPSGSSSDGIVYYTDVKTIQYQQYLREFGFSTRVYRMPNLSIGAIRAAKTTMRKAFERCEIHEFTMRPDLRVELEDKLSVTYNLTGTNTEVSASIIVEGVSLSVTNVSGGRPPTMSISGRKSSV